jgi:hypothetical protein
MPRPAYPGGRKGVGYDPRRADVAQLVEHWLPKPGVAGSSPVVRFPNIDQDAPVGLYFGPDAPAAGEDRWIKTIPDKGWFTYFRVYGPETPVFDGTWQLPDFEPTE